MIYARTTTSPRGFIALTSAIIIAAVLLGITATLSTSGYFARGDSLTTEYKRMSLGLAESCVNIALLNLAKDYDYAGGGSDVVIGQDAEGIDEKCHIDAVSPAPSADVAGATQKTVTITAHGIYRDTYSDLSVRSTLQNPTSPVTNTYLTVSPLLPAGANPSLFQVFVDGVQQAANTALTIAPGISHVITMGTTPSGYSTDGVWFNDCDATGHITPNTGTSNSCSIYYTSPASTASLTVVINVLGGNSISEFTPTITYPGVGQQPQGITSGTQTLTPGSYKLGYTTLPGYNTSGWDCTQTGSLNLSAGQTQICSVTFYQPAPSCADTIMMFDHTGSMTTTDLNNEKAAGQSLIGFYGNVNPFPKLGEGSFDSNQTGHASIPTGGQLGNNQATLLSTLNSMLATAGGGTDIAAAINVAAAELNGSRHTATNPKVLILVSDGEANYPTFTGTSQTQVTNDVNSNTTYVLNAADAAKNAGINIFTVRYSTDINVAARNLLAEIASGTTTVSGHQPGSQDSSGNIAGNTGFKNPSTTGNPNSFINSDKGTLATDGVYATDNTTNDKQTYGTFNLPTIPSGATISGIEASVRGYGSGASGSSQQVAPASLGTDSWTSNSGTHLAALQSAGGTYMLSSTNGNAQTVKMANATNVPAGATITSVVLTALAAENGGTANIKLRVENATGGSVSDDAGHSLTSTQFGAVTRTMATNPVTGAAWTATDVNNWNERFGVVRNNTGTPQPRVDQLYVTVNYTSSGSCNVSLALYNTSNGNAYTAAKTVTLGGAAADVTPTGNTSTDLWGKTWAASDFTGTAFTAQVTNVSCSGGYQANIDSVSIKVDYSGYDTTSENSTDGDNYYITPLSATQMQSIFNDIGAKVCPAVASQSYGHLYVITDVVNTDGGTKQASDFNVSISGGAPNPGSFVGSATGKEVFVTPGSTYSVTQSNTQTGYYPAYRSANCTGSLSAGESKTCVIVNDDIPVAPTQGSNAVAPPSNINIGSWQQTP